MCRIYKKYGFTISVFFVMKPTYDFFKISREFIFESIFTAFIPFSLYGTKLNTTISAINLPTKFLLSIFVLRGGKQLYRY